jgi:hypothetical protein
MLTNVLNIRVHARAICYTTEADETSAQLSANNSIKPVSQHTIETIDQVAYLTQRNVASTQPLVE